MPIYVKKPVPVEARPVLDALLPELLAWAPIVGLSFDLKQRRILFLKRGETKEIARLGDYIVKEGDDFFVCKRSVFERTYELLED